MRSHSSLGAALLAASIAVVVTPVAVAQNVFFGAPPTGGSPPALWTSDPDGNGLTNILPGTGSVHSVDIDPAIQRVFWTEATATPGQRQVRSASFTGGSPTVLASFTSSGDTALAVDTVNQRVYWSSGTAIHRSDYSGGGQLTVLSGLGKVEAIEVDRVAGKVYWTDWGIPGIARANLDGTSPQTVLSLPGQYPLGITVDPVAQKVYWSDIVGGNLWQANYNGTAASTILTGMLGPAGLDLDLFSGRLYMVERRTPGLGRVGWTTPSGGVFTPIYTGQGELFDVAVIVPEPGPLALLGSAGLLAARFRRRSPVSPVCASKPSNKR